MRVAFKVRGIDGEPYDAPGIEVLPGLALVEVPTISGLGSLYTLTHIRSGLSVEFFEDVEHAGWCANQYLAGVDWTQSAEELRADKSAVAAFEAVHGSIDKPYRGGKAVTYSDVQP